MILDQIPVEFHQDLGSKWPYLVAEKILLKIAAAEESESTTSLLNFRLVCKDWNEIIENTSELIKKLTFVVNEPKLFLDLAIVKRRKVKSIKLINSWPGLELETMKKFFDAISNSIEIVHFSYLDFYKNSEEICEIFKDILGKCNKLKELIVDVNLPDGIQRGRLFRRTHDIEITAANNIETIAVGFRIGGTLLFEEKC